MEQPWTPRPKPDKADRLERRIEFADYATTRDFLERLNNLSEDIQRFPDISFGRTYVNLTVRPDSSDADALISPAEEAFARQIDGLLDSLSLG